MKKKLLFVLVALFLVAGLVTVCKAANNISGTDNICQLSGPNPDCPDPDCDHNGPKYRRGK